MPPPSPPFPSPLPPPLPTVFESPYRDYANAAIILGSVLALFVVLALCAACAHQVEKAKEKKRIATSTASAIREAVANARRAIAEEDVPYPATPEWMKIGAANFIASRWRSRYDSAMEARRQYLEAEPGDATGEILEDSSDPITTASLRSVSTVLNVSVQKPLGLLLEQSHARKAKLSNGFRLISGGCFAAAVEEGGNAALANVRTGDRLKSINDADVSACTFREVINLLQQAGPNAVELSFIRTAKPAPRSLPKRTARVTTPAAKRWHKVREAHLTPVRHDSSPRGEMLRMIQEAADQAMEVEAPVKSQQVWLQQEMDKAFDAEAETPPKQSDADGHGDGPLQVNGAAGPGPDTQG